MNEYCILAIDNGGSQIKGAVYDLNGHEIYSCKESPKTNMDSSGVVERDPEEVWKCNCNIISKTVKKMHELSGTIVAVSLCGYGGGTVILDHCLKTISPIIVSTDTRAKEIIELFEHSGINRCIFEVTHQYPWEGQLAPLLCWFARHQPALLEHARYALSIKDYIRFKLTGRIALELTDASNNNVVDPLSRTISTNLLDVCTGFNASRFLDLPFLQPTDIAGYTTKEVAEKTGLPQGIPVVAGLYDVCACTLGSGQLTLNTASLTIGTWVMTSLFAESYQDAADSSIVTTAPEKLRFLVEQGSATGTINLNMVLAHLRSSHPDWTIEYLYHYCSESILQYRSNPPEFIFVPGQLATETPLKTDRSTLFSIIQGIDDEQKMLYSVLEGISFSARRHLQLLQQGQKAFNRISLAGGITNSAEWCQLLCDIIGLPAVILETSQNGALGAAMCASVSIGEFENLIQASEAMCHIQREIYPSSAQNANNDMRYHQYCEQFELKAGYGT